MRNREITLVRLFIISVQTTVNHPVYLRNIIKVENTGLGDALGEDEKKGVIENDFQVVDFSFFLSEQVGAW